MFFSFRYPLDQAVGLGVDAVWLVHAAFSCALGIMPNKRNGPKMTINYLYSQTRGERGRERERDGESETEKEKDSDGDGDSLIMSH